MISRTMGATLDAEPATSTLLCTLSPGGRIDLHSGSTEGPAISVAVRQRIAQAFARARGHGVLHLGAGELNTDLHPTLGYWREFGKNFVARACGALDPTEPKSTVVPDISAEDLAEFAESAPPMVGAEFITPAMLAELWTELGAALTGEAGRHDDGVQGYLRQLSSVWNVVGRVCFHLAENKRDPDYPFAFIATHVHRVSKQERPQHLPLGQALKDYAGAKNRQKLIALLAPLSRAAEHSSLVRELVDSGDIYHPLSWTPREAHRFLSEIEAYERSGLVVRTPDWWNAKRRPRPKVSISVGGQAPQTLGVDALLDFDVGVAFEGERLTKQDVAALLASSDGLVLLKGKWVEVDKQQLGAVLDRWSETQKQALAQGISFGEAVRMLAGARLDARSDDATRNDLQWSEVIAGKWLSSKLERLRSPDVLAKIDSGAGLQAELRPYQKLGVQWLWTLRSLELGGCLADDMGLGKTIQVLGLLAMIRSKAEAGTDLLVVPASLIDNWRQEASRFAPKLKLLVAHPSRIPSAKLKALPKRDVDRHDAVITTYGTVTRTPWMQAHGWRNLILDEAQAIKNPGAAQTKTIKTLNAKWRLALTGTPVENRLGDLWSLFDFLNPGLLGSAKAFNDLCKSLAAQKDGGYAPLRKLVQPYVLRRLKTDKTVISDLPDKTELRAYCPLSKRQAALYQKSVGDLKDALEQAVGIHRRGIVLAYLTRFKQICNHPSQWLGDDKYEAQDSGKFGRLRELCESIAARQDKVLVFTQFREMTAPLSHFLAEVFERPGLVLHGGTPIRKRQQVVRSFQEDEHVPFMVLSLKAGGTGLNLTAASHVVHFDRWWNPAVENQATDRAFRIGQSRNVLVHKFVCRGTLEERIDELIAAKQNLSNEVLAGGKELALTEMSNDELLSMVSLDLSSATNE